MSTLEFKGAATRLLHATVALLAAFPPVRAQTVSGTLVDVVTDDPVVGAYIVLLDVDSAEVTRVLTNPLGQFEIHSPRAGAYRVRTERIGYRSIVSSTIMLADGETSEFHLQVEPLVLELETLMIEGARECRVIGDQALEVLTVWEEARKALTAVAWTGPRQELIHELERFERWYTPSFRLVHEIRNSIATHQVLPFRSRSVEELEERGYVVLEEDSIVYEAPDAEVFFSEPFLQHHCFRLDDRRERGRQKLGLRFEPVPGRDNADVKGVFWIDAATSSLERLELSYVNVGVWQRERGAAGELEFEQLPDGRWFVSRWWIRMPLVRRREGMLGPVWQFQEAVVGFEQEGGEVIRVFSPDGRTVYARNRATVAGTIFDSTSNTALAGAYVHLAGTSQLTISEIDGSYWLTDLPEGDYTLTFEHPRAELLGISDSVNVVLEPGGVTRADLAVPSSGTIVGLKCGRDSEAEMGMLIGRVTSEDTLVPGADVRVVWLERTEAGVRESVLHVETDEEGVYRACAPRETPLSVEVMVEGLPPTALPALLDESALLQLDIELLPP